MPLTNTPERPLKKNPTFKRLWHMALQLWYHRQIIRRYKARPIKYKKACHALLDQRNSLAQLHRIQKRVSVLRAEDVKRLEALSSKMSKRINDLDALVQYHREFIIKIARDSTHQATPELMNKALDHIRNEPKS